MGGNHLLCQEITKGFQANAGVLKDQADNPDCKLRVRTKQGQVTAKQNTLQLELTHESYRTIQTKAERWQNNQLTIITGRQFAVNRTISSFCKGVNVIGNRYV